MLCCILCCLPAFQVDLIRDFGELSLFRFLLLEYFYQGKSILFTKYTRAENNRQIISDVRKKVEKVGRLSFRGNWGRAKKAGE